MSTYWPTWVALPSSTAPVWEDFLASLFPPSGVTFVDSASLGGLLGIFFSAKSDGCSLALFDPQPQLRDLLNMTHLASVCLEGK
jgi:hypothetical protein